MPCSARPVTMWPNDVMNQLVVKRLGAQELGQLKKLFAYKDPQAMVRENAALLAQGAADIFALYQGRWLIGELRVKYKSEDARETQPGRRAYLYAFRITPRAQGKGYGTYLLEYVLALLRSEGYTECTVGVEADNARARHIYKKHGFCEEIAQKEEVYEGYAYAYTLYLKRL